MVSEKGFGKRTKVSNFPSHKRGGVGAKKPQIVTTPSLYRLLIQKQQSVIGFSGMVKLSTPGLEAMIAAQGRTTQGVTIMRLSRW